MKIIFVLALIAGSAYAIYKLLWTSPKPVSRVNAIAAGLIALVMLYGVTAVTRHDEPKKLPASTTSSTTRKVEVVPISKPANNSDVQSKRNVEVAPTPEQVPVNNSDTQVKSRIEGYLKSLPGAVTVIVRGDSSGIVVDCDYDFGTSDKAAAKNAATNLIYDIMDANGDCTFNYISINCMNGRNPAGVIVSYENGEFKTLP